MKSINKKLFGFLFIFTIIFTSYTPVHAGIVPDCGKVVKSAPDASGNVTSSIPHPCNFSFAIDLINNFIRFLLFTIATPLAAIAICYAGFQLLFSGGSSEKITKAKKIMTNVIVGYIIALAAWLIVKTIFTTLGFHGETFLR